MIAIGRFLEKKERGEAHIQWWSWYALLMSASWVGVIEW